MVVASFASALARDTWREEAACRGADTRPFFSEPSASDRTGLTSPATMEAMALCLGCPVRRECLQESLTTWVVPVGNGRVFKVRATGVWAATTFSDRQRVRDLPIDVAIDQLEHELPDRLSERIEAFERRHPEGPHRGCSGARCRSARDALRALRNVRAAS